MPATELKGTRIKARWRKRHSEMVEVPYRDNLSDWTNHSIALLKLVENTPLRCADWQNGETEHGYIWVAYSKI
jgi:hypothetical protein